jgi:coproporphyrinogen III oxidase-like Fe-S oxidoreductase
MYLHVPFCEEPCQFCSFHRVRFEESLATAYFHALREEIRRYGVEGFRFDSLSVGGGTPTVLPSELAETLRLVRSVWPIRALSVETNPSHLTPRTLDLLRESGVQRLSVGVQTFRDDVLAAMGRERYGSSARIRSLLGSATPVFPTLNVDLIFGFPGQTADMSASDAAVVRELGIPQVTFYPFMRSLRTRATLAWRMGSGPSAPLDELFRTIRGSLGPEYRHSSAWCFSRRDGQPSDEYIVERSQYAGLGAGSFGYIGDTLWATTFSILRYIEAVRRGGHPIVLSRRYSRHERAAHRVLMEFFGGAVHPVSIAATGGLLAAPPLAAGLGLLRAWGALRYDRGVLRTTERGQYLAVLLMKEFFQAVNEFRETCRAASQGNEGI